MKKNRLIFGPLHSVACSVARCIERAAIDPRFTTSELTAHKAAFFEQGANLDAMIAAEVADIEMMRQCARFPGGAFMRASAEAAHV